MTVLTTTAFVDQLFDLLAAQGVTFSDITAAKAAAVTQFTGWLGGDNALPADLGRKLSTQIGVYNAEVLARYDFWTVPANGGPHGDGTYDLVLPDGTTTQIPGLAKMLQSTAKGDPGGVAFAWSSTTTDSDPGAGGLRFNNSALSSVSKLFFDLAELGGADVTAWLESFDDSTTTAAKGYLYITQADTPAKWSVWKVTGSVETPTGYRKVPVSYLGGVKPTAGARVAVQFVPAGGLGGSFLYGAGAPSGGAGADGDVYLNISNGDFYGPKTSGAWGGATSSGLSGFVTSAQAAQTAAETARDAAVAAGSAGCLKAVMTGATVAAAGVGDVTITNAGSQANAIQTIDGGVANGASVTLVYRIDPKVNTISSNGYRRVFLRSSGATVSTVYNLIADGEVHFLKLTSTGAAVAMWFQTAEATFRIQYALIRGSLDGTAPTTGLEAALQFLTSLGQGPLTGLLSSVMTGSIVTANGIGDVTLTNTGGQANGIQAVTPLAQNDKVTLVYRIDEGGTYDGSGYRRAFLYAKSIGSASPTYNLNTDGKIHALEMVASTRAADQLYFQTALSTFRIHYALIKGSIADLTTDGGRQSALLGLIDALIPPPKAGVEDVGLLKYPLTSAQWTVAAPNPGEFTATVAADTQAYQVLDQLETGVTATLVYQFGAATVTNVDVRFDQTGPGSAGPAVRLNTDGGVYVATLTSGDAGANRLMWSASLGDTFSVRYALIRGSLGDASQTYALGQTLITLLNVLASQGGERWSDADKDIFFPSTAYFVAGRDYTMHGRRLLRKRSRVERMDLWLSSAAAYNEGKPPLVRHLIPCANFNADRLVGTSFDISLRDPNDATLASKLKARTVTWKRASATQAGTLRWVHVGDSLGNDLVRTLYYRLLAAGLTPVGYGTVTEDVDLSASTVNIKHEARAGWSTSDYIARTRPTSTNAFWKTADATDKANNPTLCFADNDPAFNSGAGYAPSSTTARTSYAEDLAGGTLKASYSIFSWNAWRQNVAVGLDGTEALKAIIQLGRNDGTALDVTELGQVHMVKDFLATFPNGHVFIGCEGNGSAFSGLERWTRYTAPLIERKLSVFDINKATKFASLTSGQRDRIRIIPAWAFMSGDLGYPWTVDSTNASNGTETRSISDDVHPVVETTTLGSLGYQEWAEAALGPVLYAHEVG